MTNALRGRRRLNGQLRGVSLDWLVGSFPSRSRLMTGSTKATKKAVPSASGDGGGESS
jgi:hypothetical protein